MSAPGAPSGGSEASTVERWVSLSADVRRVRNLCVLAHVDHGKTTLSDCLIAHNGLIHPKMVGKLRYMDFRDDEQARVRVWRGCSCTALGSHRRAQR